MDLDWDDGYKSNIDGEVLTVMEHINLQEKLRTQVKEKTKRIFYIRRHGRCIFLSHKLAIDEANNVCYGDARLCILECSMRGWVVEIKGEEVENELDSFVNGLARTWHGKLASGEDDWENKIWPRVILGYHPAQQTRLFNKRFKWEHIHHQQIKMNIPRKI